jgi:hypothetical protein
MNYAYSSPGISTSPWVQAMQGNSPSGNPLDSYFNNGWYNKNPDVGFDKFLQLLNPSLVDQGALRQLYPSLERRWSDAQWHSQMNGQPLTSWTDYLGTLDVNRELARLGSSAGRYNTRRFNGPTRVVTF